VKESGLSSPDARRIAAFLEEIGIELLLEPLDGTTFLPGLTIRDGRLIADPERLEWIGDLLHEAGHIAVTDPALRPTLCEASEDPGEEMAAIAWSWAAALAIGLDPQILFHAGGYRGASKAFIENFSAGRYLGVPMLHYFGMTVEPRRAPREGEAFPAMRCWLREAGLDARNG
jgi:hypothetical protein